MTDTQATSETTTASMVQGSQVLNPATLDHHSRFKGAAEYVGEALLAGLVIGMAIVVVRALITDRLRRRDDIAEALGARSGSASAACDRAGGYLDGPLRVATRRNALPRICVRRCWPPRRARPHWRSWPSRTPVPSLALSSR